MQKPSFFRAIAMYFDIAKAQTQQRRTALTSKWFKIQCLSSEHDDNSMDSSNLPKEDSYINSHTNQTSKSMMKCFSCNNTVSWKNYNDVLRKANQTKSPEDYDKLYDLIDKRSNINNPIEFLLKILEKYNVPDAMIKNFYDNKPIELLINNETLVLRPNELLEISDKDFKDIVPILKDTRKKLGEKVFTTGYLYENETPSIKSKRIINNSTKYLNAKDKKILQEIIDTDSKDKEDFKKIKIIEETISKLMKKEWQEKDQIKTKINEYIINFYKNNGTPSQYFKNRGMEESVLVENDVLEIDKVQLITLKRELIKKYKKENLFDAGVLGSYEGKETFIFETHPIIVPLKTTTYVRGIQFRCDAKKDSEAPSGTRFKTIGSKNSTYWENNVANYEKVIVTEGYSDALSMSSILKRLGINNIKVIGVANATNPYNRTLNKKFAGKSIYKLLDNDDAGKSATKKLFNEMLNGLSEGTYKFKDIAPILKNYKDLNEYYTSTDLSKIKEELNAMLNSNDEKQIELLSKMPENGEVLGENTIIDLENMKPQMYKETDSKKVLKLDISQQIELLFDGGLSIDNKNYTADDITISNDFIYDKELYNGHKLLAKLFENPNVTLDEFNKTIATNSTINRMYHDVTEKELSAIAMEYREIAQIEAQTDIKNLDIHQYITNMQQPVEYMLKKKIPFTPRGSAGASIILTRQIRMNQNTNACNPMNHQDFIDFKRFMSVDRKNSLPDVDIDVPSEFRNDIREACNYFIPKTKSGQKHNSRSYPISIKLRGKELENKEVPLSDKYLEKFYPSFDILAVNSMHGIEAIYDFSTIPAVNKEAFFNFSDKYLHVKTDDGELAGKIYGLVESELKTTQDIISLLALNKTPFNANNFEFIKKYVERLKNRENSQTSFDFLKNTNGFIIYQEQLLAYLALIGISGEKRNKIRKLNTKPNQATEEQKIEIESLYKEVEDAVNNYSGEHKAEIKEIFDTQYVNLKYNAYIFNFPHALAYHNINMNVYFEEMVQLKKALENSKYDENFSKYKKAYLNLSNDVERKKFLEPLHSKYKKLTIQQIKGLILLDENDFNSLKAEKEKQQNIKLPPKRTQNEEVVNEEMELITQGTNNQPKQEIKQEPKKPIENEKPKPNPTADEELVFFKENRTKGEGKIYYVMNKKFNKVLENEESILKKYKYQIKFFNNSGMYTIWDKKAKDEIESLLNKYTEENERFDILQNIPTMTGGKNYLLNKKFNSLMYKLMKQKKFKDVIWNSSLKSWEITSKESKKEVISHFSDFLKENPDFLGTNRSTKTNSEPKEEVKKENKQISQELSLVEDEIYTQILNLNDEKIISFLKQVVETGETTVFEKDGVWFVQTKRDNDIDEDTLAYNKEIIRGINKKIEEKINAVEEKSEPQDDNKIEEDEVNIPEHLLGDMDEEEPVYYYEEPEEDGTVEEPKNETVLESNGNDDDIDIPDEVLSELYEEDDEEVYYYEEPENEDKQEEALSTENSCPIKVEESTKFVKISGELDELIIQHLNKLLNQKYEYIKYDANSNEWLIQIADYNEMGEDNLKYNLSLLQRIKDKMGYKDPTPDILIKEDNEYIKIKGELPQNVIDYLKKMEKNQIFYHEGPDFWSFGKNPEQGLTEAQIAKNYEIIESIKNVVSYKEISDKTTQTKTKHP